jgi:hypothetical protein
MPRWRLGSFSRISRSSGEFTPAALRGRRREALARRVRALVAGAGSARQEGVTANGPLGLEHPLVRARDADNFIELMGAVSGGA